MYLSVSLNQNAFGWLLIVVAARAEEEIHLHMQVIIYSHYHSRMATPGNITSLLPSIVYECAARVNNIQGNERVMFLGIAVLLWQ